MGVPLMQRMRRRLRLAAAAWLACQMASLVGAPVVLHAMPSIAAAANDEDCCPGVAPGQVCSMHHTKAGARHCAMRSACGSRDAALLTLAGLIAVPAHAASTPADAIVSKRVGSSVDRLVLRAIAPE